MAMSNRKFQYYPEDIMLFMDQNPGRNVSCMKLHQILSLFEKWMFEDKYRSETFEKQVLHYIAKRAVWSNMKDSEFVSKLLNYFYKVDGDLTFFISPDEDKSKVFNPENPYFTSEKKDVNYRFLKFFLNHAYRHRLIINGKRIVDLKGLHHNVFWQHPCEMAFLTGSPELLHTLLRYGALITYDSVSVTYPLIGIIFMIILVFTKTEPQSSNYAWGDVEYRNIVTCARLLMRASPQFDELIKFKIHELVKNMPGYSSARQVIDYVTEHHLPELRYRMYFPVPLMHACRLKIRRTLHDCWKLPFGIKELPLPNLLKGYLDLYYD